MKIAFASGKGGTGKTTISVNLARTLSGQFPVQYVDCDVEEPNGHLFMKPHITNSFCVTVSIPKIDEKKCTHCSECANLCAYNAIASLPTTTIIFRDLCHSCGGCKLVCPTGAITEIEKRIGIIERGVSKGVDFVQGRLDIGEARSSPLIRALEKHINSESLVLIDSPPGANCAALSSIHLADKVVLVAEPTPFGLSDLMTIVEMVKAIGKPFGVVINKWGIGNDSLENWCKNEHIAILGRIPHDIQIARQYSTGMLIVEELPDTKEYFEGIVRSFFSEAER